MTIQQFATKYRLKLRVDPSDGTHIIPGRVGQIYEYDPTESQSLAVLVMPKPARAKYWTWAKKDLQAVACKIVQDGDGEGSATFDPSNLEQARIAIKAAKVKKKRVASPAQLAQLDSARRRSPLCGQKAL